MEIYWTFNYSPVKNESGTVVGVFVTCIETTEKVLSQRQQVESEARFQAAISAVEGVLWTNNAVGEMEGDQPGWSSLTGQNIQEYRGMAGQKLFILRTHNPPWMHEKMQYAIEQFLYSSIV